MTTVNTHKQPVHDQDSEVQRLLGAGFTNEKSVRAIKKWKTAAKAMKHLLTATEPDDLPASMSPVQEKEMKAQYQEKRL